MNKLYYLVIIVFVLGTNFGFFDNLDVIYFKEINQFLIVKNIVNRDSVPLFNEYHNIIGKAHLKSDKGKAIIEILNSDSTTTFYFYDDYPNKEFIISNTIGLGTNVESKDSSYYYVPKYDNVVKIRR